MYKYLLCWRYLLTRYLALACIISVMLGVATLIVVNSVMCGFSTKLKDRLHGILADILLEAPGVEGFGDPQGKMAKIRNSPIGDKIVAMAMAHEVFAMIQFQIPGETGFETETITRGVRLIGIEPENQVKVDNFASYLSSQKTKKGEPPPPPKDPARCFELSEEGKKVQQWLHPPMMPQHRPQRALLPGELPEPDPPPSREKVAAGIIVGHSIAHFRGTNPNDPNKPKEYCMLPHGQDVIVTTVSGQKLTPVFDRFAVADYFQSEMSEYDSNYVYVPLEQLQKLRTMEDRVTSIQIKLKDFDRDAGGPNGVVAELRKMFPRYSVVTWQDKQSSLLSAIDVERGLLNILLFLIIGVAGFGILAIFSMIVIEKTRDIGILKALGASNIGVMKIFVGYGLLLGVVGAVLGTLLGLTLTTYINEIEHALTWATGHQIFDRRIYYFDSIPTTIQPMTVFLVNVGAIGIAVLSSVLPSLRAALLHPVRALRYE